MHPYVGEAYALTAQPKLVAALHKSKRPPLGTAKSCYKASHFSGGLGGARSFPGARSATYTASGTDRARGDF